MRNGIYRLELEWFIQVFLITMLFVKRTPLEIGFWTFIGYSAIIFIVFFLKIPCLLNKYHYWCTLCTICMFTCMMTRYQINISIKHCCGVILLFLWSLNLLKDKSNIRLLQNLNISNEQQMKFKGQLSS